MKSIPLVLVAVLLLALPDTASARRPLEKLLIQRQESSSSSEFETQAADETPDPVDTQIKTRDDSKIAFLVSLPFTAFGAVGTGLAYGPCTTNTCMQSKGFRAASLASLIGGVIWSSISLGFWVGTNNNADPIAVFSYRTEDDYNYTPVKVLFDGSKSSDLGERDKIRKWKWNFGDGQTAITNVPTTEHIYTMAGTLTVTLTVVDDEDDEGSSSLTITLRDGFPNPIFECVYASLPHFAPLDIDCDGSASTPQAPDAVIVKYEWDFGDHLGFQNLGPVVSSYRMQNPGTYAVKLRLTDSLGVQKTLAKNVVIPDGSPVSSMVISYSNAYQSPPITVTYDGSASHIVHPDATKMVKHRYILPGEAPFDRWANESQIITRDYDNPGTFPMSFMSFDDTGRSSTNTQNVVLNRANPIAVGTYSLNPNEYNPTTVTIDPRNSRVNHPGRTIVSYSWYSSVPGLNGVTYPPDGRKSADIYSAGSYRVQLIATDNAGLLSDPIDINFSVKDGRPIASFSAYNNYLLSDCATAWIDYNASGSYDPGQTSIVEYNWYVNGLLWRSSSSPYWTDSYFRNDRGYGTRTVYIELEVVDGNNQTSGYASTTLFIGENSCP